ncbi:immunity repressor [Mycobacterium phage PhelpsODU]|uniref:Immunity repressor n=1 Tax=Mycobacterium phage Unicorn TaxID=2015825 RepID=A0A222ZK06_9CAUD|nr:transcriptional repressor [Mycobacterium phage Unicorn]ASR85056.1 immunity repressor [Mycobacterium phage Unicorn]ASR85156.1 immunity repressor [Mycobacterium phage PhelpsODU]
MDDTGKSLAAVLGYLVGRPLKLREITEALQISRSRYYAQIDEGKLITADNLVRVAENLDINEVELLARFGIVRDEAVLAYADALRAGVLRPPAPAPPREVATAAAAAPAVARAGRRKIAELSMRPNVSGL